MLEIILFIHYEELNYGGDRWDCMKSIMLLYSGLLVEVRPGMQL